MLSGYLGVLAVATALLVLWKVASGYKNPAKTIIFLQVFFWAISFVGRPLVLLGIQPSPKLDDSLADPRLAALGYDSSIAFVLQPVLFGIIFYTLVLWAVRRKANTWLSISKAFEDTSHTDRSWLFLALFVGWVSRLIWFSNEKGTFFSSVSETFSWIAIVAIAGLLRIYLKKPQERLIPIALLGAGELLWSFLFSSKTPVIGFAILCIVLMSAEGWSRRTFRFATGLGIASLASFPVIQALKFSEVTDKIAAADSTYPLIMQPLMPFLRRFDLLSAVTDATFFNSSKWLSYQEYLQNALLNLVPQQLIGASKLGSGSSWAINVRSASIGSQSYDVSLAEGFIGEGYLLGGIIGVAVVSVLLVLCLILISTQIKSRNTFSFAIAAIGLSFPVLFERGFLGFTEVFGKSLQVAILVLILKTFVGISESITQSGKVPNKNKVSN
jgi:hypothetical protein